MQKLSPRNTSQCKKMYLNNSSLWHPKMHLDNLKTDIWYYYLHFINNWYFILSSSFSMCHKECLEPDACSHCFTYGRLNPCHFNLRSFFCDILSCMRQNVSTDFLVSPLTVYKDGQHKNSPTVMAKYVNHVDRWNVCQNNNWVHIQ